MCVCRVLRLPWRVPAVAWAELSVLLLCVRDGRALFLVSPLPFPFILFQTFFGWVFRFSGRSKENWRENFSKSFIENFLNFARNLIFGRNWFFHEEELIKSSESSVVCEPPNFVLLLLLLVDSHGNNNFWFEYFVGSWKFTTFFFLFRGRKNFVSVCVVRGAFVSGPTTSREKKTTATFFWFSVCRRRVCSTWASASFECDEIHSVDWRDNLKLENSPKLKKSSKEKEKKSGWLETTRVSSGVLCCCCCCFYCVRSFWVRGPGLPTLLPTLSRSHSFLYIAELSSASSSSSCPSRLLPTKTWTSSEFLPFRKNKTKHNRPAFFWVVSLPSPTIFVVFDYPRKFCGRPGVTQDRRQNSHRPLWQLGYSSSECLR